MMKKTLIFKMLPMVMAIIFCILPQSGVVAEEQPCHILDLLVERNGHTEVIGDQELDYRFFPLTNPERLIFDFKNATLTYNEGCLAEIFPGSTAVDSVTISQFSLAPDIVRLVIEPTTDEPARISRAGNGTRLVISFGEEIETIDIPIDPDVEEAPVEEPPEEIEADEPADEIADAVEDVTTEQPEPEVAVDDVPEIHMVEVPFEITTIDGGIAVDVHGIDEGDIRTREKDEPSRLIIDTGRVRGISTREQIGEVSINDGPVSSYETLRFGDDFRLILDLREDVEVVDEPIPGGTRLIITQRMENPIRVLASEEETEIETEITPEPGIDISAFDIQIEEIEEPIVMQEPAPEIEIEEVVPETVIEEPEIEIEEAVPETAIEEPEIEIEERRPDVEVAVEEALSATIATTGIIAAPLPQFVTAPVIAVQVPVPSGVVGGADYVMLVGEMATLATLGLERVSVGAPTICSVNIITPEEILITALAEGQTAIMTWEKNGRKQVKWVEVHTNVESQIRQLNMLIDEVNVVASIVDETVILEGSVDTDLQKNRATSIATSFRTNVIDLIEVLNPVQVMVKVRMVEIDKKAIDDYFHHTQAGVRSENNDFNFSIISAIIDPEIPGGGLIESSIKPGIVNGSIGDIRFDPIDMALDYLETERKANILSEPNLLALSGTEAKFRVGGEIPYTYQNQEGINVVEFKEFGVELNMTPIVNSAGSIRLKLEPRVRTVDLSLAIGGIPGFRTREMTTEVQLRSGQTMVIGGLIQNEITKVIAKVPILGDVPILGQLFTSKKFQEDVTELLVFITPIIVDGEGKELQDFIVGNSPNPEERAEMFGPLP